MKRCGERGRYVDGGPAMGRFVWWATVFIIVVLMPEPPSAEALCNASCGCDDLQSGVCSDQGQCGNKPCEGPEPNAECPDDPPASLAAIIVGDAQLALYWNDPVDHQLVDEYNIFYTIGEGAAACSALSDGVVCSFAIPGEESQRTGECGFYDGGSTLFCWLDLFPKIVAVLPCTKNNPSDPGCNYQELNQGVVIGRYVHQTALGRAMSVRLMGCVLPSSSYSVPLDLY